MNGCLLYISNQQVVPILVDSLENMAAFFRES